VNEVATTVNANRIDHRASFHFIRYANCWEDAEVLCAALQPQRGMRVLSIASGGDNSLALLAAGAEVVAADLSVAQLACLDLRVAAFRRLDYEPLLAFLGARSAADRLVTYGQLEKDLTPASRHFWSEHPEEIAGGILHAGKFEDYFRKFRTWVLPLIHSKSTTLRLLEPKDPDVRKRFWNDEWNNRRWRFLFRIFFSRFLMGRLGRDPEFFRYVQGSVSDRLLQRAEYALTVLPTHDNPFLDYIVHGNFCTTLPLYLRHEKFDAIRSGLDRLTLVHSSIEEAGQIHGGQFDAFNLSDIFEYLDPVTSRQLYGDLVDLARPGARFAYWNTLVQRSCPAELIGRVRPLKNLARELFLRDRAFFYCNFEVDEVS
jgi:S-adenosylmethionine-diacylglycerol 3-amino-3-carboxypropyl transferase